MYLMNVPPVAATQTEWRTCGPHGGYSLPICFNDSDNDLSTRGTPISDKVQMIIESLRNTQSSLEMGDEVEGNVPTGQEGHPQVSKVAACSYVEAKTKTKGPVENQHPVSSPISHQSSDSDSDDSVDRGIEEAILEYLKEKDDHKRKAEPSVTFLQSSKIPRRSSPVPEFSKHNSDSNASLVASGQFPTSVKAETSTAPAVVPIKKHIKNKAFINDNTVKKWDSNKSSKSLILPREQTKSPSKTTSLFDKAKYPVTVEADEDSSDSSSDDGIEEAIQRYQLEKKKQENKREAFTQHGFKEESDSTSDDGIEEAIRCYQLEQLKEKSILKPLLHKQKPFAKALMHAVGSTSMEHIKKQKLRKKKTRVEKEAKSVPPAPLSVFIPKGTLLESSKGKGNGLLLFKAEGFKEQPTPAPPKVNTTAELMCAEAILDISKTVMPGTFQHSVGLSSCTPTDSSLQSSLPDHCPDEESDGSSIDSEDGIEQEIRKFLEQKAQMHQQPTTTVTQEPQHMNEPEKVKAKHAAAQKKPSRLSLTQKRKNKAENCSIFNMLSMTDVKVTANKPSLKHGKDSSQLVSLQRSTHNPNPICRVEQSGDKSSSLDSDEDLDTAIKDLLKTKKKSKKKTRDSKRKSRIGLKDGEPLLGNASGGKKLKPDPALKRSILKKVVTSTDDMKDGSGLSKKSISPHKQTCKRKEHDLHEGEPATQDQDSPHKTQTALQIKEESSSVDSDDSIELEIQRFLAEKAKVFTIEKSKYEDLSRNGTIAVCTALRDEDVKQENQLAEIPRKSVSPVTGQSPLSVAQSLMPDISAASAQSHLSSVQSCSLSLLEPADGAGAARADQRRPSSGRGDAQGIIPQTEGVRPVLTPNIAHSCSESNKWRRSLGLPTTDTRLVSRTSFHITSKISETAPADPPCQSEVAKSQTPVAAWSSARASRAPFPCSTETNVNTTFRSPVWNHSSSARQHPRTPFTRSITPGHRSQCSIDGETESMVHISKDKSVFVELESNRTNHVQVRSREMSEGKERANLLSEGNGEGESKKIDDKEVHLGRREDEFIDEANCESGSRRNPEKKQGFSTLSLSSAIDPGITFRPCIALTTEERSKMFNRRYLAEKCNKGELAYHCPPVHGKAVQRVKRKLQFIPVNRRHEEPSRHGIPENRTQFFV